MMRTLNTPIQSRSKSTVDSMSAINTTADEACAFNFSDNQGRHYHKTEFILYWREVEVVSDLLGRIFYDEDNQTWTSMTPAQLREIALANVLREDIMKNNSVSWESPIYGSAIAFEPGVWTQTDGLAEGVSFPASSVACRENTTFCESPTESSNLVLTELNTNNEGMTLYSPYAFRGPSDMSIYQQCSEDKPEFCPSMDLAFAYDYSNITTKTAEWYNAPRCLYLRDGIRTGYWTSPYFDAGAGNVSMVTYAQPIISQSGKFLGVTTIDIAVDSLCYGEQCDYQVDNNYLTNIRPAGFTFVAISMAVSLGCGGWTYKNRKDKVIIASQPFFLLLICAGCFIMASAIIPLSIDDSIASPEGCSKACMAFPWLLSLGFTAIFSALTSKTWRLNRVVENARRMRRVTVKEMDAILPFAVLMTINFVIMLSWNLVDPLVWVRTEPTGDYYESYGSCEETYGSGVVFKSLIGAVNFLGLVLATAQAYRARNISSEFSDAFYIMMTMSSLLQTTIIGVPLLILVQDNMAAMYFIWCGMIFVSTTAVCGLMFGPKILLVRQRARRNPSERSSQRASIAPTSRNSITTPQKSNNSYPNNDCDICNDPSTHCQEILVDRFSSK